MRQNSKSTDSARAISIIVERVAGRSGGVEASPKVFSTAKGCQSGVSIVEVWRENRSWSTTTIAGSPRNMKNLWSDGGVVPSPMNRSTTARRGRPRYGVSFQPAGKKSVVSHFPTVLRIAASSRGAPAGSRIVMSQPCAPLITHGSPSRARSTSAGRVMSWISGMRCSSPIRCAT